MKRAFAIVAVLALIVAGVRLSAPEEASVGGVANSKPFFDTQGEQVYTDCDLQAPKRQSLENDLKNLKAKNQDNSLRALDAKEKASLKGCEIAKTKNVPKTRVQFSGADYEIEIVEMNPIDGGVEVFARAWTPDGTQIGFGKDGTVDIERFRIINPPVLSEDASGTIVRSAISEITGELVERRLKEDPATAVLQSIAHTISVKTEVAGDENIIPGKRGNTTSTFYPDADPESSTVDGTVSHNNASWATLRAAGTGTSAEPSADGTTITGIQTTLSGVYYIRRIYTLFNTASLGTDTISSATYSQYLFGTGTNDNSMSNHLVAATPASNTNLTTTDYDIAKFGSTSFGSFSIPTGALGAYYNITVNASGLAAINGSGITYYGTRISGDLNNTAPGGVNQAQVYFADRTGTTNDPKLVVEHTASASTPTANDIIFYN